MAEHLVLKENNLPINRVALRWLREAKAACPPHYLHLLSLADWGLEHGAEVEMPAEDRYALVDQVSHLFAWAPKNALAWLVTNQDGPPKAEQEAELLNDLQQADSPKEAAERVLAAIWSKQVSENPALQPASTGSQ
jgi:hypothetical protein